jgi:RNA polymerase sigma-70 factor (ECF subfamily)
MGAVVRLNARAANAISTAASRQPLPRAREPRPDALADLLIATARGDVRSFERLYELIGGRLLAVARSIVRQRDVAEDVLQEGFIRIWRSAHLYEPEKGSAYAWCVTIVRNRALSMRGVVQRHEGKREELDAEATADDGCDGLAEMMRSEEARRVKACLEALPAMHRRSIALVYFEGLSHRELARRLDVPFGTAKSWVRRGLAQLARSLLDSEGMDRREFAAAEYALGSLQGPARSGFERRRQRDARYCRAADSWETQLAMLTEFLPDGGPAPIVVWQRIARTVLSRRVSRARLRAWLVAATVLAASALVLLAVLVTWR